MSSITNIDFITIPTFGDITNISGSFSYNGGSKVPCADLSAPAGLEQYYCTADDMNNISIAINDISNYLNQGKTSKTSVYTKQYIDDTFYTKTYISGNYYTKSYINSNYYTKTNIDNKFTNYYTITDINSNYYTITDINSNYYTKTDINSNYYTKTYISKNYPTRSETTAEIINAYKSQKIDLPVDNISIKANNAGELYVNLKGGSEFHLKDFSTNKQQGVIHAFNDGINLLWDYTLSSKVISDLPVSLIEQLWGVSETNKMKDAAKNLHYLTVNLDNVTLSSSIDKGIFINYTENHFFEPSGKFALKFNTNMFSVDKYGLNARLKDTTLEVDSTGIGVKLDNKSLIVDNSEGGEGIGVPIDNQYIVLGPSGYHAGNTVVSSKYGLTLGSTYKQKIANAPVYIPPAKGQILYLVGTESKIINAISGCLQDIILTYGESFKFNDATWIFPQSVQLYQEIIWNDALKATAAAIRRNFVDDNHPYLPWSGDDKITLKNWMESTENNKNDIIINSNGSSQFQIYVFPIPSHKAYMWPNTLISWVDSSVRWRSRFV